MSRIKLSSKEMGEGLFRVLRRAGYKIVVRPNPHHDGLWCGDFTCPDGGGSYSSRPTRQAAEKAVLRALLRTLLDQEERRRSEEAMKSYEVRDLAKKMGRAGMAIRGRKPMSYWGPRR